VDRHCKAAEVKGDSQIPGNVSRERKSTADSRYNWRKMGTDVHGWKQPLEATKQAISQYSSLVDLQWLVLIMSSKLYDCYSWKCTLFMQTVPGWSFEYYVSGRMCACLMIISCIRALDKACRMQHDDYLMLPTGMQLSRCEIG